MSWRIVLDPVGRREVLRECLLGEAAHAAIGVEHDRARAGGALVEGERCRRCCGRGNRSRPRPARWWRVARSPWSRPAGCCNRTTTGACWPYIEVGGEDVGAELITRGLAYARSEPHPRKASYHMLNERARRERRGIYAQLVR
jgi:hypothetical protein